MKNYILVGFAAITMVSVTETRLKQHELDMTVERYESRLEIQAMEYQDELVDVRQELAKTRLALRGKQFEFDMATNRVEQLNKEIGEGGQHD